MLVNILIGATIALLPLYNRIVQIDFSREFKDNLCMVLMLVLTWLMTEKQRYIKNYSAIVMLFFATMIIFNQSNWLSPNEISQTFFAIIGMTFFTKLYTHNQAEGREFILYGMAFGCIVQCIFGIAEYYGHEPYYAFLIFITGTVGRINSTGAGPNNVVGSLGNTDLWASYVAITALSILSFKKSLKFLIIIPIVALGYSHNRMGMLSLVAGAIYFSGYFKKWLMYIGAISVMLIYPFLGVNWDNGRLPVWIRNLEVADTQHWLIGKGVGWFADQKFPVPDGYFQQEHNAFLTFFNVFGLLGFLLLAPIFWKFVKSKDTVPLMSAMLFVAFCNSYGHFTIHQSTVVLPIIVLAGICLGECDGLLLGRFWSNNKE